MIALLDCYCKLSRSQEKPASEDARGQGLEIQLLIQLWSRLVMDDGILKVATRTPRVSLLRCR